MITCQSHSVITTIISKSHQSSDDSKIQKSTGQQKHGDNVIINATNSENPVNYVNFTGGKQIATV